MNWQKLGKALLFPHIAIMILLLPIATALLVCSMVLIGYFFGQIPFVQKHIEKMLLLIIFLSLLPIAIHAIKEKRNKSAVPAAEADAR